MKLGAYEFRVLWTVVNNGGHISLNDLKEDVSGYKSANSRIMPPPLYHRTEKLNKAVLRACRSLHRKGMIFLEEAKPHIYSDGKKPTNVLLREEGLRIAHLYALPRPDPKPNQVPYLSIITDASPQVIHTYDAQGQHEETHMLEQITAEEYFRMHNSEPLEST